MIRRIASALLFSFAAAVFSATASHALYSQAQVNTMLPNGVNTAVGWDNGCRNAMRAAGSRSFASNPSLRKTINNSASYKYATWMSGRNTPNVAMPITVTEGVTNLQLQINDVIFLCGPLVQNDMTGGCRNRNISGVQIANNGGRWTTPTNVDKIPNGIGSDCMSPALTRSHSKVKRLDVVRSTYGGTVVGGINRLLVSGRTESSRYWRSGPVLIQFNTSTPVLDSGEIVLRMRYKKQTMYHSKDMSKATVLCWTGGPGPTQGVFDIERCGESETLLRIRVAVKRIPWQISGTSSVDVTTAQPDQLITWTHELTKHDVGTPRNVKAAVYMSKGGGWEKLDGNPPGEQDTRAEWTKLVVPDGRMFYQWRTTYTPTDADVGKKICQRAGWQPATSSNRGLGTSRQACVEILPPPDRPFTAAWGSDIRVGGRTATDTSDTKNSAILSGLARIRGRYYGSWSEYGLLAPGRIVGAASGSGTAKGAASNSQNMWSRLSFANPALDARCAASGIGCFASSDAMGRLPDVVQAVEDGLFDGMSRTNTPSLGAQTISGNRLVYRPGGTVTITGDITYPPGPFASERDIPQLLIVADKINIRSSVERVDAWLVATGGDGTIDTCSDSPSVPVTTACEKQLVVNGPVIAKTLLLRRTGGSTWNTTNPRPAEIVNLRGDTYLWAREQARSQGGIRTVYTRELAPRY
ncbi:hypothetical protein CR983_00470 [Candidatus Saccharibacteria bacterium]|nr:MAG: hypothetical protein CR983_00470 [Candidatus Saccharibacteria bacterium]